MSEGDGSSPTGANSPAYEQQSLSDTVIIVASVGAFLIIGSIIIIITLVTIFIRKPKRQISDDNPEYVNAVQPVGRQSQGQPLDQKKPTKQDNQARCEVVRAEEDRTKNRVKRRTLKDEHQQGLYAQIQKDGAVNDRRRRETEQHQTAAAGGGGVIYAVLDFDHDFTENRDEAKKFVNHGKETVREKEDAGMRGAEGTNHSIKKRSKKDKGRSGNEDKCKEDGREDVEATATNREDDHLVEEERSTNASPFNIGSDGYVKMKPPDAPRISEVSHSDSIYSLAKDPDLPNNVSDHDTDYTN